MRVLLCILVVLIIGVVVLYFVGRNMQKKQEAQQAQIEAMKQTVSMLIIDKKRMKLKEAGLPQAVIEQTPKMLRNSKIDTRKIHITQEPERMVVNVDYALDINYEYLADCQIVMDIRSKGSAEKLIV